MNSIQNDWIALDTNEFIFAMKGDANIPYLISENRHFIRELNDLLFKVLTSTEAIDLLG